MKPFTLNFKGKLCTYERPQIMGILNITPDSFFDGGQYQKPDEILFRVEKMLNEGSDLIDIGAVSTRSGAEQISENEEIKRLTLALETLTRKFPDTVFSVDTYRASVAEKTVRDFDVAIINDISAGNLDPEMLRTVARLGVPYVMMHMSGTPETMQNNPQYDDVVQEILLFFAERIHAAHQAGIADLIVDPGFGFGKTVEHNFEILKNLEKFHITDCPVLVGLSRKSMIYKTLQCKAEEALNGTTVLNTAALLNGADILRVHDVKQAVEAVKLCEKMK